MLMVAMKLESDTGDHYGNVLTPLQLGVGVKLGCEAILHTSGGSRGGRVVRAPPCQS